MRKFLFLGLSLILVFSSCVLESNKISYPTIKSIGTEVVVPYERKVEIGYTAKDFSESETLNEQSESNKFTYQWYESADGTTENSTLIKNATNSTYIAPQTIEKGFRYYYRITYDESSETAGEVITVACTGLPLIVIDTVGSEEPYGEGQDCTDGGGNYGYALINTTKVPGRMQIFKYGDNSAIYDSGDYVEKTSGLTIKLRGNTSAGVSETGPKNTKHPYKIKLQKKADLLAELVDRNDKKYKDKNWILLKDGTSLNTFVGLTVSDIAGTTWTPEFAYVNVVLNGSYRGIYMLIESISKSEARADVADDGYILERDAYWYNEDVYFKTNLNQKYTFKYPDNDEISDEKLTFIKNYMESVETSVQNGTYENYIDYESFARWQLIHDALGTWDSAGSNIYLTKYDSSNSKLKMCTPWDFDSNYRMTDKWANTHAGSRLYENYLFKSTNTAFLNSYKSQWESLSPILWSELFSKLSELSKTQGEDINLSRKMDSMRWNFASYSTVEENITTAKNWFSSRIPWLDSAISEL